MGRIPNDAIERLKKEIAVERLAVAHGVELRRRGADHLGSAGVVTDDAGAEVDRFTFEPFGTRIGPEGDLVGAMGDDVKHGFTGHRHDDELERIDMRGRIHDPAQRRFLTPDPRVTEPLDGQSYNRYSYVINDPVTLVDPTGALLDVFRRRWPRRLQRLGMGRRCDGSNDDLQR